MWENANKINIEVKLPQKISANSIYSGSHWGKRAKAKDIYLWSFLPIASKIPAMESCDLEFDFEFKSRALDCDNCFLMVKLLIDCMRHYNKIKDDTPEIVKSIKVSSRKGTEDKVNILIVF